MSTDNFKFSLVSEFPGYNSARDKTNLLAGHLIKGSKNVIKKISGTIASREGLKRRGDVDDAEDGVTSSFEWESSLGIQHNLRVLSSGVLQVEFNEMWQELLAGLDSTRMVFDTWWNDDTKSDILIFVNGDDNFKYWTGGIATIAYGSSTAVSLQGNNVLLTSSGVSTTDTTIKIASNDLAGLSFAGAIVFNGQPTSGAIVTLTLNGMEVVIRFIDALGNPGDVLIGATVADTITNLRNLLSNPNVTNSTQIAVSPANQTLLGYVTSAVSNVLVKNNSDQTWAEAGFDSSGTKKVVINGTQYLYSIGTDTDVLTGVVPDPSGEAANSVALSPVETVPDIPVADFEADFLKVINNQIFIGSYSSRVIYISASTVGGGFPDFSNTGTIVVGDPTLVILDNQAKGIGVREGKAVIFGGDSDLYVVEINIPVTGFNVGTIYAVTNKVQKKKLSGRGAAMGHEFIDTFQGDLIWLDQNNQLRALGSFSLLQEVKPTLTSLEVYDEFTSEDFTGGHLRSIDNSIHITAPISGRDWEYEIRQKLDANGNIVSERIWQPPQIRGISRFAMIDGLLHGHSSVNPQLYQVERTSQWHDDSPAGELSYVCVARFPYTQHGRPQGLITFDKVYYEGYVQLGAELLTNIYYEYGGAMAIDQRYINGVYDPDIIGSIRYPTTLFSPTNPPSLGDSSLGDNPLGDGLVPDSSEQELLPKFRSIINGKPRDVFEYSLEVFSVSADSRWELIRLGTNADVSDKLPVIIRK